MFSLDKGFKTEIVEVLAVVNGEKIDGKMKIDGSHNHGPVLARGLVGCCYFEVHVLLQVRGRSPWVN